MRVMWKTVEYTYDAQRLKQYFLDELIKYPNCGIHFNTRINSIKYEDKTFEIQYNSEEKIATEFVLNATYASTNQILETAGFSLFDVIY